MAYHYKGVCYETPDSFLTAMAADAQGVEFVDGRPVSYISSVSGGSITVTSSDGNSITYTPTLTECQLVGMADAATLSGLVILVWAVTFAIVVLRNGVDMEGRV